jgi:alkylation response protein AidB-like acyl-CoA dehydrogenase
MDLDLDDDQVALRDGIASLLEGRFGSDRVREGFDRAMFAELAGAGVFALRRDGFSWADCVVVFEQLGRACVPGPLVPSLLLGDGRIAGVADADRGWVEHLDSLDVVLVHRGSLRAVVPGDLDADPASWPLDPLTPVARVAAIPEGEAIELDAGEWYRPGATLTAALQLGLADRLTQLAVAYAKERTQFDRPIGSFQAVKHLCADMVVRTELARAAVYAAGAHLDESPSSARPDRPVSVAKIMADDAAIANGKAATQVFGGMGFTWEVDVHLYLKRAWVLATHFDTARTHATLITGAVVGGRT